MKCYYADPNMCGGELWDCQTCKEWFCQFHTHMTELGYQVECVACERTRIEANHPDNFVMADVDPPDVVKVSCTFLPLRPWLGVQELAFEWNPGELTPPTHLPPNAWWEHDAQNKPTGRLIVTIPILKDADGKDIEIG